MQNYKCGQDNQMKDGQTADELWRMTEKPPGTRWKELREIGIDTLR